MRVSIGGAEVEAVVVAFVGGVLRVRLPQAKMQKATRRGRVRRKANR